MSAPPAFTGGRGLKHALRIEARARPGTARLHRRARIETQGRAEPTRAASAPPAFTGGRGLKRRCRHGAQRRWLHRPPSPAGAD